MIRLYPEQLAMQLENGLCTGYLLFGNEPLLLQESQDTIRRFAQRNGFTEHRSFTLDLHTPWDDIFSFCHALSLFSSRQSLLLLLPDNGPTAPMSEQLCKLCRWLHDDLLVMIRGVKLTKAQENGAWFNAIGQRGVYVSCQTPEKKQLRRWIVQRSRDLKVDIDNQVIELLCRYYEGNLLALSQSLERLALLCPGGKLTLPLAEQAVDDAACFTHWHWLDALLAGDSQRSWNILQQLRRANSEPVILLRSAQTQLLLLFRLKRHMMNLSLGVLFDRYNIWKNRRELFAQAVQRLSLQQLQQAIHLLTHMEIHLKQNAGHSIWSELESLSLLICGNRYLDTPLSIFDAE